MFKEGWCTPDPARMSLASGLGWSSVGSLRQSTGVGPGYLLYLGGLVVVGFDKGCCWVVSLFYFYFNLLY
jgi:hypothetical protein